MKDATFMKAILANILLHVYIRYDNFGTNLIFTKVAKEKEFSLFDFFTFRKTYHL